MHALRPQISPADPPALALPPTPTAAIAPAPTRGVSLKSWVGPDQSLKGGMQRGKGVHCVEEASHRRDGGE